MTLKDQTIITNDNMNRFENLPEDIQIKIYFMNHKRQHRKSMALVKNICYNLSHMSEESYRDNSSDIDPADLEEYGESLNMYEKFRIQPVAYFAYIKQLHYDCCNYCLHGRFRESLHITQLKWTRDGGLKEIAKQIIKNDRVVFQNRYTRPFDLVDVDSDREIDVEFEERG